MMTDYVWRDGSRLTPYMAYQIDRLSADMLRLFGVEVRVTSGIRTNEEQTNIFTGSYTLNPNGQTVYDTRWWNGQLWYRIDPSGTVAQPGTSNHEIQGTAGAVDLQDTGNDGGIATMGSARSEWLRTNCGNYGMEPEGFSFGEAWHYKFPNIFLPVPAGYPTSEEDNMPLNADSDYAAFSTMLQRALRFDVRPNGVGADWKLGPTLWERLGQIQSAQSGVTIDPKAVASAIAGAIPDDMAKQVADELAKRLQA